jgi:hypothetical protein
MYQTLVIETIKNNTQNITLPELTDKEIDEYKTKYLTNYSVEPNKDIKYKFKNIRDAFIIIHKRKPEDKKIQTIIKWLKEYNYIIELIEETEPQKENYVLKRIIQTLHTQINTFNNLYEEIIKDTQTTLGDID